MREIYRENSNNFFLFFCDINRTIFQFMNWKAKLFCVLLKNYNNWLCFIPNILFFISFLPVHVWRVQNRIEFSFFIDFLFCAILECLLKYMYRLIFWHQMKLLFFSFVFLVYFTFLYPISVCVLLLWSVFIYYCWHQKDIICLGKWRNK